MSDYLKSLIGKRAKFTGASFFTYPIIEWKTINTVELEDDGTYTVKFLEGGQQHGYDAWGNCEIEGYSLVLHPDEYAKPGLTRAEIQAEIDRLQAQLAEMPAEFQEQERYIGWNSTGGIALSDTLFSEVQLSGLGWEHVSRVKLIEIERIR